MPDVSSGANLVSLVPKLAGHRVLCIGDVMVDRFIYGQVERISPEAPIPVIHIQREAVTFGGAGNVMRNITALGGKVDMIGVIGQDQEGADVVSRLAAMPQVTSHIITDNARPTTLKTRYVADGQQLLRADFEINKPISVKTENEIIQYAHASMENCAVIVLSDYAKGVLTPRIMKEIIRIASEKGRAVLIDPKGRDFSRYNGATYITPNRRELGEATGMPVTTVAEAEKAARKLIEDHTINGVLAKLGADGVCLVLKGQPARHLPASAREVFDVSGAGDTVVAALALGLAGGLSEIDSAALANAAGSIVVGKVGTATVSMDELQRELMHGQTRQDEEKLVSVAHAAEIAERWRSQGLRIGFTNGCFDLLHPGHISLIRQARAACDRLILGLNSDASIKRLKGEGRPVQNEIARATVIASLADVDNVVIFREDTPEELIKTIRPSVLVKGADYTVETVVGADLVQGWGGQVLLAKLVEGQSTTRTIARMRDEKSNRPE